MYLRILLLLAAVLGLAATLPAGAETRTGDIVRVTGAVDDDLYASAGDLAVEGSVDGDAVLAGGLVSVAGDVAGDVIVAGGRVRIAGGVGDDLRATGGDVNLSGFVTDHAALVGGTVRLESSSAIGGWAWIAGGNIEADGEIGGDLHAIGGSVTITGRVDGDADITAREIRVAPGAVISGDLVWHGRTPPVISEGAQVQGAVVEGGGEAPAEPVRRGFTGQLLLAAAVFIAAAALFALAPVAVRRAGTVFRARPGRVVLVGAAVLLLAPVVAITLLVTVLGWVLGVLVLAGYVFALLLASLLGLLIAVELILPRLPGADTGRGRRLVLLVAVTGVFVYLQGVPYLGMLVPLLLVVTGLGTVVRLLAGRGEPGSGTGVPARS